MEDFLCGGVAAAGSICVMNPVDVVKTRLQLQGELTAGGTHHSTTTGRVYKGVVQSLYRIATQEGIQGLQRGLSAALFLQFTVTATRFGVYALGKTHFGGENGHALPYMANLSLAMIAGACGAVCGCPFFSLKTQFQTQTSVPALAVGHQRHYTSLRSAFIQVYTTDGVAGYWRGLNAFMPRVMAFSAVQLATYDAVKQTIIKRQSRSSSSCDSSFAIIGDGVFLHLVASTTAAICAVTAMQPFDFIAARLMNQPVLNGIPQLYLGMWDCFHKVIRVEDPTALFKGATANYCRMCPYTVLTFLCFEQLKKLRSRSKIQHHHHFAPVVLLK
jgi:solute carrier family 25 protein 34/35